MSMVKVIEVIAESKKSWDAAAENAVKEACCRRRENQQVQSECQDFFCS